MFDIQRFADTVTSSTVAQLKFGFEDDDNRTVDVPNPKLDITPEEIVELETWIVANNAIVGDKAGAAVKEITSATLIDTTRINVDLS